MRIILKSLLLVCAVVAIAAGSLLWWYVYRPLPQLDGSVVVPGLHGQVTVDRDRWGVPYIRASSLEDAAEAQGYVTAQDRLWQMDLLRRVARGQLSEILGQAALKSDEEFRTLGLAHAADADLALADDKTRAVAEAYARGVNRFIEQHRKQLPLEFTLLKYQPQPWQASDSLVISGYMFKTLTDRWRTKLNRAKVLQHVDAAHAKDLFSQESPLDEYIVGDPDADNASGKPVDPDDDDEDDMEPDDVLKANLRGGPYERKSRSLTHSPNAGEWFGMTKLTGSGPHYEEPFGEAPDLTTALAFSVSGYLKDVQSEIRQSLGSNNWVVSGAHTSTHKPLLANDTHLELTMPSIWWEVHLNAPGYNVEGFSIPGTPLVIIGHNDRIAWGFTNNHADVQDLYIETFNADAPDEYRVPNGWVKAQVLDEVIHVKNAADEHWPVTITRHGPIVAREGGKVYALRWTALEPGALANSYEWMGKARDWQEFRSVMKNVWGPAQNAVYADVAGNIGYLMAAKVPVRKLGHDEVPIPGDTDAYEWTGYIPFDELPQTINPESGLIATANARVVGPKYKPYLTDNWADPYRTSRIYDLLLDKHALRPEDMLRVQTDVYSTPHVFLAEQLIAAAKVAPPKDQRTQNLITQLKDWNGMADANSPLISFLDFTRLEALKLILQPYLGEHTDWYTWRSMTFLQTVLTDRPTRWLPSQYKTYDDLLSAAADQAVSRLTSETGSPRFEDWSWRRFNTLNMMHPLGRTGLLKDLLSITDQPQSGTMYTVRASNHSHGPSERFVANPGNWDQSILLISTGESGQLASSHYKDQFSYWFDGKPIYEPFSDAAEAKSRRHELVLKPGP